MDHNEPQPVIHHKRSILRLNDLIVVEDLCRVRLLSLVEDLVRVIAIAGIDEAGLKRQGSALFQFLFVIL